MADNNTLDQIRIAYLRAAGEDLMKYRDIQARNTRPVLDEKGRVRLFESLNGYIPRLVEYGELKWPAPDPETGKAPDLDRRAFEYRMNSLEAYLNEKEKELDGISGTVDGGTLDVRLGKLLATAKNRTGLPEKDYNRFVKDAEDLRTRTAAGTALVLRTPSRKARFEEYNRHAFLRIVFGPNYEALAEHYPQAYDSMHDYMGNLYDYASGKEMSEDESERKLDPVLEAFGYVEGFNYGLSLDDFEKNGKEDPSMRFAQNHSYHGKSISELQEYANRANTGLYNMWLNDALAAVMEAMPRGKDENEKDFRSRALPIAAKMLSGTDNGNKPYGSWMVPYQWYLGNMYHRLHLDPEVNVRLFNLVTGGELEFEKKEETKEKKPVKKEFAVGDIVTTPSGTTATVSKVEDNMVTISYETGKTATFDITRADLSPGVVQGPVKSGPPAGTPCLRESLEAAKEKLKHIKDVELPEISQEVADARALGDLRENAEYQYGKEKLRDLTKAAERLSDQINKAVVLSKDSGRFGKQFTYTDMETNKTGKVTLVGPWEADGKTLINCQSPLGEALWTMEKGETKSFGIGDGQRSIRLDDIGPSPSIPRAKLVSAERFGEGIRVTEFKDRYDFLSNMYGKCSITAEVKDSEGVSHKVKFSSSEALYQASKLFYTGKAHTPTPAEVAEFNKFASMTGEEAKKAGRNIPIDKARWDSNRIAVMERCLNLKFQDPELAKKLAETGTKELSEGNVWKDSFWGVYDGKGENHLGKLLMKVRNGLVKQSAGLESTEKQPVQPARDGDGKNRSKKGRQLEGPENGISQPAPGSDKTISIPENMDVRQSPEDMAKTQQAEEAMTAANDGNPADGR